MLYVSGDKCLQLKVTLLKLKMFTAFLPTYTKVQMVPCTYKSIKKKVLFGTFLEKLKVEWKKKYIVGYRF